MNNTLNVTELNTFTGNKIAENIKKSK